MSNISEVLHGHVSSHIFEDDGMFPNNSKFPVLIYKGALFLHPGDSEDAIVQLFAKNNWTNAWVASVYNYHHYHSLTHEVLGVFCGTADIQLGGSDGICVEVFRGDVIIIPAGVAHKCIKNSADFVSVGAYPNGKRFDVNYGKMEEREIAIQNINSAVKPELDPVFGVSGPLIECW